MKDRYFYLYVVSIMMINTLIYFPYILINRLEDGFTFAILIGFFITSIITMLLIKTYNSFSGMTLIDISRNAFGERLGSLFSMIFIVVCFSEGSLLFLAFLALCKSIVLTRTSVYVIAIFPIIIIICCLLNNEKTMLIIISFFTYGILLLYPFILAISFKEVDFRFMEGALRHSVNFPPLESIAIGTFFFAGIENLALFNTAFKKTNIKGAILIYIFIGIPVAFLTVLIPVGVWGNVAAKHLYFPTIVTNDTVAVDLFIIERALFIVFPIYFALSLIGMVNYIYVAFGLLKKLTNDLDTNKYIVAILVTLLLYLSKYANNVTILLDFMRSWSVFWMFFLIFFSISLFLFSKRAVKK